jgi:hypothetical protein
MPGLPALLTFMTAMFMLVGCGGGGSGSGSGGAALNTQDLAEADGRMLSFEDDIEPVLQAKCIGCHNSGDNPLAPFSLEGEDTASSFKSAIHFAVDSGTMPPLATLALTEVERGKLIAWSTDQRYGGSSDILRIALAEPEAWDVQSRNRDVFLDHRPDEVDCARDSGWLVEDGTLEVRTEFCNYLSLTQQSLVALEVGTELELVLSHSELNFNAPSSAHVAVSVADATIWETSIAIPSDNKLLKETLALPVGIERGDPIEVHLHNHGDNAWTIHSLDAFVPADQEVEFCPTFDSTFEAIQAVVFEQAGCANSLCHSEVAAGGLDLTPANAFDNLVGVPAQGSSLLLVAPRNPSESYLYHKLSAKTFPGSYAVDGSPMPSAGPAISPGQLEAIRLWIEAGAPKEGSVGDTLGRGEDELERLLGVCLPEAEAVNTIPLPAPERTRGVQFVMPPHDVPAEEETEICFAAYYDFRDQIPPEYMDAGRENFYFDRSEEREDAFTHHNVLFYAPLGVDKIHDPSFGEWTCAGGDREGELCEPTDLQSCGAGGLCRSEMKRNIACRGYGPPLDPIEGPLEAGSDRATFGNLKNIYGSLNDTEGFYETIPTHGIFYWNSHAFNLTTEDGVHHVWRNYYFADDRRFQAENITYSNHIYAGVGTPPFEKQTVCRDYTFNRGDGLLMLSSHTHKRGEHFYMSLKGGEQIYETFTYDEPLILTLDPPIVFNSNDPAERTVEYCATYNNGVNDNGAPNIETVTRLSRRPPNTRACQPVACVAGKVGAPCNGADDDAACDSSPGAGDGWCDACAIAAGVSSDDEMFILIANRLPDYDAQMMQHAPGSSVTIIGPGGR